MKLVGNVPACLNGRINASAVRLTSGAWRTGCPLALACVTHAPCPGGHAPHAESARERLHSGCISDVRERRQPAARYAVAVEILPGGGGAVWGGGRSVGAGGGAGGPADRGEHSRSE